MTHETTQEVVAEIIHVFPQPDSVPDTWRLLRERGCVTTRETADALGITRKAAWKRLSRLRRRGYVETHLIDGVVRWCLAEGAPPVPRRKPRGPSRKTLARIESVYAIIEREGCVTTEALRRELGLSHTQVRYTTYTLLSQGRITEKVVGATALWCRDHVTAQLHIGMLRNVIRGLVKDGVKYVTPTRVLEWINQDREARRMFSRYVSLRRHGRGFPAATFAFVSDILRSLYGEPAVYSNRVVYFVMRGGLNALPDYVAMCCDALRTHIGHKLTSAKGGVVSVKVTHLTKDARLLPRYSHCLSRLLKPYRLGSGYVIPRTEAQELLNRLEQLCGSLVRRKDGDGSTRRRQSRGDMPTVSLFIARDTLAALDRYAEEAGVTRSDVIRQAIRQLLEKLGVRGYDNMRT
jgi:predicted DNA-binding transcriptional regulator